jgi:hypothetical protein
MIEESIPEEGKRHACHDDSENSRQGSGVITGPRNLSINLVSNELLAASPSHPLIGCGRLVIHRCQLETLERQGPEAKFPNNLQNANSIMSWAKRVALIGYAANPRSNRRRSRRDVNPFVNVTDESLMSLSQD